LVQQICRQYAAAADALPHGTMYAQCMCARGYRVAGFSPLLGYGYQCELRVGTINYNEPEGEPAACSAKIMHFKARRPALKIFQKSMFRDFGSVPAGSRIRRGATEDEKGRASFANGITVQPLRCKGKFWQSCDLNQPARRLADWLSGLITI
jgi:hypothetical protein